MDVKLKVLTGKHAGMLIPMAGPQFLIGRAEDCHLRSGSDLVSRHHCVFLIRDSYVGVKDFGSRNGTLVNDEAITDERELHAGDKIQIGSLQFELMAEFATKAKKRPPVKSVDEVAARTAAANKSAAEDDDISDWLGEPDPKTSKSGKWSAAETKVSQAVNSDTIKMKKEEASDAPASSSAIQKSGIFRKDKAKSKEKGKLPKYEAPPAANSQAAAEMALRKMAKRR